jgi:hypothetical protein
MPASGTTWWILWYFCEALLWLALLPGMSGNRWECVGMVDWCGDQDLVRQLTRQKSSAKGCQTKMVFLRQSCTFVGTIFQAVKVV